MDLNQISAKFNIANTCVRNIQADCKMASITDENKKEFNIDIKHNKPVVKNGVIFGKLLMQVHVKVENNDEEQKYDEFHVVTEGIFYSPDDVTNEEFLRMLNLNGAAALYSIVRAKIEALSAMTYSEGKIVLPMINLVQYYAERAKLANNSDEQPS